MKNFILYSILIWGIIASQNICSQNTFETAIDVGIKSKSFSFYDKKDTHEYTNNYSGMTTNDVFYKFTLTQSMDIVLMQLLPEYFDSWLYLLTESKVCIASIRYSYNDEEGCEDGSCVSRWEMTRLAAGTYYVVSEGYFYDGIITTIIQASLPRADIGVSNSQNYVQQIIPQVATTDINNLQVERSLQTIQYFDGLGRTTQTLHRKASANKQDMVSHVEYDYCGREYKAWLPVSIPENDGGYVDLARIDFLSQFSYGKDNIPSSLINYEDSPLNRVSAAFGPGKSWRDAGRSIKTEYLVNSSDLQCRLYKTINKTDIQAAGYFEEGQLYVTKLTDEDNNVSYEFKDKLGLVILTRQINNSIPHDTYYVYDDFNNLTFVLPPLASDELSNNGSWTESNDALKKYAYLYQYDHRNRCIAKRLPGTDWQYFVYDKSDRIVLSQNGEQRRKYEWSFNKYDIFGRVVVSGTYCERGRNFRQMRDWYNSTLTVLEKALGTEINAAYGYIWPGDLIGSFPTPDKKILQVYYYDDYNHLLTQDSIFMNHLSYERKESYGELYANAQCSQCSAKGLLTGKRMWLLDGSGEIVTAFYYDDKGRVVQKKSTNHLGGFDKEYVAYTFTGLPTKKLVEHSISGHAPITEHYTYNYDHAGRLVETFHQINDQPEIALSQLVYNELGEIEQKLVFDGTDIINYSYNIRGWLKKQESILGNFSEELFYEDPDYTNMACYNGNISQIISRKESYYNSRDIYSYQYDGLNRLITSNYHGGLSTGPGYSEYFSYDKQGNILELLRRGATVSTPYSYNHFATVNDLAISYEGNRMKNVENGVYNYSFYNSPYFLDYAHLEQEYVYDANGNMTQDFNKGITKIRYNCLNLPESMQFTRGHSIDYLYDASGVKRKVVSKTAQPQVNIQMGEMNPLVANQVVFTDVKDYIGNMVYTGNGAVVSHLFIPEGYIKQNNDTEWEYIYQLKDHLGSVQREISLSQGVYGNMSYYASGVGMVRMDNYMESPYRYNGKEYQAMHGLNLYDYLARQMDPQIPRFTSIDPMAEKYYSVSPYVYCANNPVKFIDPTGMELMLFKNGVYVGSEDDGKEEVTGYNQRSTVNKDGKEEFTSADKFSFNDIELDRKALKERKMTLFFISDEDIEKAMVASGVTSTNENRYSYIERESRPIGDPSWLSGVSQGKMDYRAYGIDRKFLHIVKFTSKRSIGYNYEDYGNFLWGQGGKRLNLSHDELVIMSQLNNAINGKKDNPGLKYRPLDSAADQRAISDGFYYDKLYLIYF